MGKALIPRGGNDVVMTPRPLAKAIIEHFKPVGRILDPCRGEGAFYDQFPQTGCAHEWGEITEGRDFLASNWPEPWVHCEWCISNPPWSQLRNFTYRAMGLADNIIWLCTVNHFWLKLAAATCARLGSASGRYWRWILQRSRGPRAASS